MRRAALLVRESTTSSVPGEWGEGLICSPSRERRDGPAEVGPAGSVTIDLADGAGPRLDAVVLPASGPAR